MTEDKLCMKCLGVGYLQVRPDQLGYLWRPELDKAHRLDKLRRVYEHGDGTLQMVHHPFRLCVQCASCRPSLVKGKQ